METHFERLMAVGEPLLQAFILDRQQEDVDLEFKGKNRQNPRLTDADKQVIGKTLSAFANSAGGLLVLGVDARPDADGVDRVTALSPFPNLAQVLSDARSLAGNILMPRHDGIRVEAIASDQGADIGYLAFQVERSERRPHMSKAPGDSRYYKRGGTNSYVMEHYDVEDAFRRVATPQLEARVTLGRAQTAAYDRGNYVLPVQLALANTGIALARYPFIHVFQASTHVYNGIERNLTPRWALTRDPPGDQLTGSGDTVIHAGTTQIAGYLGLEVKRGPAAFEINGVRLDENFQLHVNLRFGAEGTQIGEAHFKFGEGEIEAALRRSHVPGIGE